MSGALLKALGIGATVLGVGATLLSDYVGEKRQDEKIRSEVNKVFAELMDTENSEDIVES